MVWIAGAAFGDIELPSVPPPQPKAVTVDCYLGESVEIPLEGLSRSGFQLRFLIRKKPELGTLSEPVPTSRTTATIVYTHNEAAGLGEDRFRYAVQTSNTGVSTPAEIVVRVIERPPLFTAPSRLDFPMTAVGDVSHRELEISNSGGGNISGEAKAADPWKIVTGGRYDLGPGDSHSIILVFAPSEDRDYSGAIEFSHAEGTSVALFGRGYEPIGVVPRELRLGSDGRSEVRGTTFIIRNRSDVDHELRIEAPEGVLVDGKVTVPAKTEVDVAMHTRTGFLEALDGFLRVTGERIDLSVPLHVEPAPVRLAVDREEIDFGELGSGRTGRRKLVVRNTGGTPADLRVTLPEGGDIRPLPSAELLAPGASREFEMSFVRLAEGEVETELTVEASNSHIEIPVRAKILATKGEPPGGGAGEPQMPNIDLADIPPVPQITVVAKNEREVDVSWKKTDPDVARYAIFLRRIEKNAKGKAVFRYVLLEQAKVRLVRDEARATIQGFRPGEQITIQIVGYDAMGRPSPASPPFTIWSKPAKPVRIPWTLLAILGLVIAIVIVIRERRRRRLAMETWTP